MLEQRHQHCPWNSAYGIVVNDLLGAIGFAVIDDCHRRGVVADSTCLIGLKIWRAGIGEGLYLKVVGKSGLRRLDLMNDRDVDLLLEEHD